MKSMQRVSPGRAGWISLAVFALMLQGVWLPLQAGAQILDTPARTWGVGPAEKTSPTVGAPRVLAILPVGDRIVVAGTFGTVIDPAGKQYPAKNLAVFSASTGAADLSFKATANNTVTALATDGAGTVFLGGTFGTVNGATRKGLAAVDVLTGDLRPWAPVVMGPGQVDAVAFTGGALYAGGNFTSISGGGASSNPYLAKVSATTGEVDAGWAAAPNDRVRAINVAADGSARLYVGGEFTNVSAKPGTNKIAAVMNGTGDVDTAFRAGPTNQGSYAPVYDLTSDASRVYAAAAGTGGACAALSAVTGTTAWSDHTNGNLQSVRLSGGLLYCAGHFGGEGAILGQARSKLAAVDPSSGALTPFAPNINSSQGPWALAADSSRVYMGGDFSSISGVPQPHFAMFVDTAAQTAPGAPTSLTSGGSDGLVRLAWAPPSSDGGSALLKYRLYRATSPGGQILSKPPLAVLSKTTLSFDDTSVTNGSTYYYVVVASNALGTSTASNEAAATPRVPPIVTPPNPPADLTATAAPGLIRLVWSAPLVTGGAPVTSYRVFRGPAPGQEDLGKPIATTTATTFDDRVGLTAGNSYSYVVTAVNQAGESAPCRGATATAVAGTPGQPQLTGTLAAGPSATLKWTIPADGGSPITKYVIVRDAVRLTTLAATADGPTTYTDSTLAVGTTTVYQVKAVNAVGSGPLSNKVTITTG